MAKLVKKFYLSDAVSLAEQLLGKYLVRQWNDGRIERYLITETEAYFGENDKACHASKGRTQRTEIMYKEGGYVYVYLIYGMYWLLNIVSGEKDHPEAVLIRGLDNVIGPGKVGRLLEIDKGFYGESLIHSDKIWIEDSQMEVKFKTAPRIGIEYAGDIWKNKAWRFILIKE